MEGQSQGQCPETSHPTGQKLLKNIQNNNGGSDSRSMSRDFTSNRTEATKKYTNNNGGSVSKSMSRDFTSNRTEVTKNYTIK